MDPLLDAAVRALDVADEPRPLTAHHDTAWRAGPWKIKTATAPAARAALLHEARAVRLLHAQGLHPADGRYGHVGEDVWTVVEFLPGVDLWQWCAPGRTTPGPGSDFAPRLLDIAHRAFAVLGRLHAAGWRHGDIQPWNILVGPTDDVAFIDHEYAHHRDLLPLAGPYRGGMDHATVPDVARRLLATTPDVHIHLSPADEHHALAAALRWAWTGITLEDLLEDIATGRHRISLTDARPWPHPSLEALIEDAMAPNRATRAGATAHPA